MNLIRRWFVFIAHVSHSRVKVAHGNALNACIVLASKIYKPQQTAGGSMCFIRLGLLGPPCPCWRGRGGGVLQVHCPYGLSGGFHERLNQADKLDVAASWYEHLLLKNGNVYSRWKRRNVAVSR